MIRPVRWWGGGLSVLLLVLGGLACNLPGYTPSTPTPRLTSTPLPEPVIPPTPTTVPTRTPVPGWEELRPGWEMRILDIQQEGIPNPVPARVIRLDPAAVDLRIHYDPTASATISVWKERLDAPLIINGGFFFPDRTTLGLLIIDGRPYGDSFINHGGMLSISGGEVSLRSLSEFPYEPGEPIDQAVQGRPLLLEPDGIPAYFDLSAELSRRTAVGIDREGHLIFVVVDYGVVSLYTLRDWMANTPELNLDIALNLDGGGSTGMALTMGDQEVLIDSFSSIPAVISIGIRE